MKNEKRIMNISLIGSILFMLSEGIMAYLTKSHSLLMDCIFDVTDQIVGLLLRSYDRRNLIFNIGPYHMH